MADMTAYIIEKCSRMIAEITKDLSDMNDRVVETQKILRALKDPDIIVNGAPNLTLDRIQIMENGDISVLQDTEKKSGP
jgi:hypothetical protein